MNSRYVIVLAALSALVFAALDVYFHGHFNDAKYKKETERLLDASRYNTADNKAVTVDVRGRWVILNGVVPTPEDKDRVSELIRGEIPGIRGIVNNLQPYVCDNEVLAKIKSLIESLPLQVQISYLVDSDCNVILRGKVPTEQMKQAIGATVQAAPGVRKVINELEVGLKDATAGDIAAKILSILRVQNIYFDFNKDTIRPESIPSIDKVAEVLKQYPKFRVGIEGHTDSIDTEKYNLDLSNRRAAAVKKALLERGVDEKRMDSKGYGETRPIASNANPEGRAENRRIEFKVLD